MTPVYAAMLDARERLRAAASPEGREAWRILDDHLAALDEAALSGVVVGVDFRPVKLQEAGLPVGVAARVAARALVKYGPQAARLAKSAARGAWNAAKSGVRSLRGLPKTAAVAAGVTVAAETGLLRSVVTKLGEALGAGAAAVAKGAGGVGLVVLGVLVLFAAGRLRGRN